MSTSKYAPGWTGLGRVALQGCSGALVWAATPGLGAQPYLSILTLAPFLFSLTGLKPARAMLYGLSGGLFYSLPGKWSTFATASATLNLPSALNIILVLFFFLSYCLPFVLFAGLWARCSPWHAHALMPWLGGFAFAALMVYCPHLFPYTPAVMISALPALIQLADLGGEALVLGLLMSMNLAVFQLLSALLQGQSCAVAVLNISLPPLIALSYAHLVLPRWQQGTPEQASILSLQAQWPRNSSDRLLLRDSARQRPLSAIELTRSGLAQDPACALVVWPESARLPRLPDQACAAAAQLAGEYQRAILASCLDSDDHGRYFPARLFNASGLIGEHRKSRLIPVFESPIKPHPHQIRPGHGPDVLHAPGLPAMSPSICYEVHFRHDLREATKSGAGVLVHMANFAVFRHATISEWDLAMTRFRAVETRRAVVRSVNAGLAGMILPSGHWQATVAAGESGARCFRAPLHHAISVYVRWGDSVFLGCLGVLVLLMLATTSQTRASLARPAWTRHRRRKS